MRLLSALLLLFALGPLPARADQIDNIRWMSEQLPPYNYVDERGEPRGIVLEVVDAMLSELGRPWRRQEIEFLPWARSYVLLQRLPGTALFAMVQTRQREALFRFVGPVTDTRVALIAPAASKLAVDDPASLGRLRVGVVREDIGEQLLEQMGVAAEAIQPASKLEHLILQMKLGRVDAIAYEERVAYWQIRSMGLDPRDYASLRVLHEGVLSIAFHKDTPDEVIERLQGALERVRARGLIEAVESHYR